MSPRIGVTGQASASSVCDMVLKKLVPSPVREALRNFIQIEAAGGILLMASAVAALLVANSPFADGYFAAKASYIGPLTLSYWINDGLMALFFLLVGLEIKREFLEGQLSTEAQEASHYRRAASQEV